MSRIDRNRLALNKEIIKRRKFRLKASPVLVERHIKYIRNEKTVARFVPPTDGFLEGSIYTAGLQGTKELTILIKQFGVEIPLNFSLVEGVINIAKLPVKKGKVLQVVPIFKEGKGIKIDEIYISLYFMGNIK